jgi:serine/threonine-protein kinase
MAPEALSDEPSDHRADLYSVGCVAYWLLTGRHVFPDKSGVQLLAAHLRDAVAPPSTIRSDVPAELEAVVLACLAKRPEERPQTSDEHAARVAACPVGAPWGATHAVAWWEEHRPRRELPPPAVPTGLAVAPTLASTAEDDAHPTLDQRPARRIRKE